MRCVDLGCGGGEVTFEIARLVGAEGHVTGVDMDEVKLSLGRESAAQRGCSNVEFRVGNVTEWEEAGGVRPRLLPLPAAAPEPPGRPAERMWAAVAPAGRSWSRTPTSRACSVTRPTTDSAFYARVYPRVLQQRGGDAAIGRKLSRYFLDAGIPDPEPELVQRADAIGEAKTLSLSTLEATAEAIVEEALASTDEVNAAIDDLAAFTADEGTVVGDPRVFQLWSSRPAA